MLDVLEVVNLARTSLQHIKQLKGLIFHPAPLPLHYRNIQRNITCKFFTHVIKVTIDYKRSRSTYRARLVVISLPVLSCLFRLDSRHEAGVHRHTRIQGQQTLYSTGNYENHYTLILSFEIMSSILIALKCSL